MDAKESPLWGKIHQTDLEELENTGTRIISGFDTKKARRRSRLAVGAALAIGFCGVGGMVLGALFNPNEEANARRVAAVELALQDPGKLRALGVCATELTQMATLYKSDHAASWADRYTVAAKLAGQNSLPCPTDTENYSTPVEISKNVVVSISNIDITTPIGSI